jgi:exodeoxyribonuclease V beta subunit
MFDILSPSSSCKSSLFIEASAGTGKTFTIEHLFIRRLLEHDGQVAKMAVVTFTRACARALKERIKEELFEIGEALSNPKKPTYPYVEAIREKGGSILFDAKNKIEMARAEIHEAYISTIHAFCLKLLSRYLHGGKKFQEAAFATPESVRKIIFEYITGEGSALSSIDLRLLLLEYGMSIEELAGAIASRLFEEEAELSQEALISNFSKIASQFSLSREALFEKLLHEAEFFCGLYTREKILKKEVREYIEAFSLLFSSQIEEENWGRCALSFLSLSKIFAKPKAKGEYDETFIKELLETFSPILEEAASGKKALARVCHILRPYVREVLSKKGQFAKEGLLYEMHSALSQEDFSLFFQKSFDTIFVDEFQDTDPLQWKIFSETFLKSSWRGALFLVGDPKQAIYAFRKADVYSFIEAKNLFPEECRVALSQNFRSTPPLVEAFNVLFSSRDTPRNLFYLPKLHSSLFTIPLIARGKSTPIEDGKGALQIVSVAKGEARDQELALFSYIASEILRLLLPWKSFAVLVKDRYQGERLKAFLEEKNIPVFSFRRDSVVSSPSHLFLLRLFRAMRSPKSPSLLLQLLSDAPFSYDFNFLLQLKGNLEKQQEYVKRLYILRSLFSEYGIGAFARELHGWISQDAGGPFLQNLEGLVDFLIEKSAERPLSLDDALDILLRLQDDSYEESDTIFSRYDIEHDKVTLITTHKSKGLEFDVVFAIGLSAPSQKATEEVEAEKMRLFYVAATRARRRLYLPIYILDKGPRTGCAAPVELFFSLFDTPQTSFENQTELYENITPALFERVIFRLTQHPEVGHEVLKEKIEVAPFIKKGEEEKVVVSHIRAISRIPFYIDSFTKSRKKEKKERVVLDQDPIPQFGILLHTLLSEIDPLSFSREWVQKRLSKSRYEKEEERMYFLLNSALERKLSCPSFSFCLKDIPSCSRFCEEQFFYCENERRAYRGSIDLAFQHSGRYFLLDYKTHKLEKYDRDALSQFVKDEGYLLQAKIYMEAFSRYLASCEKDEKSIEGMFFYFLQSPENEDGFVFFNLQECLNARA